MQIPVRALNSVRIQAEPGLVMSAGVSTAVFTATPLLLSDVIETFDVDLAVAGFLSGAQLAGFVLTSFLAGRVVRPSVRLFVLAIALLSLTNGMSAITDSFQLLVAIRGCCGLALGVLSWLAWAGVFGDPRRMGDIAVIGPIAGLVAAPVMGVLVDAISYRSVYGLLAVASLVPLLRIPALGGTEQRPMTKRARGGSPQAYALVGALGLLTLGGSAVFVFSGVIAREHVGMTATGFSLVVAGNAAAGIPSARWNGRRPWPGLWIVMTGVSALAITIVTNQVAFALFLALWGFAFWFGVPAAYQTLAERSRYPAERAGDAQAVMAIGRIVGPVIGGIAAGTGSFVALGIMGGGVMVLGGLVLLVIEQMPRSPEATPTPTP
jgi:MFS transporter, DHA1 family, chloramphenicol resistance protein